MTRAHGVHRIHQINGAISDEGHLTGQQEKQGHDLLGVGEGTTDEGLLKGEGGGEEGGGGGGGRRGGRVRGRRSGGQCSRSIGITTTTTTTVTFSCYPHLIHKVA